MLNYNNKIKFPEIMSANYLNIDGEYSSELIRNFLKIRIINRKSF